MCFAKSCRERVIKSVNSQTRLRLDFFTANPKKCSLAITDLRMPYMNGIEFSSQVRRISSDVKLLLITAHETESYNDQITHLGFNGILRKPLLPRSLKMMVKKILGAPTQ